MKTGLIEHALSVEYLTKLGELKKELDPKWVKERRKAYLSQKVGKLSLELKAFYEWYEDATERGVSYLIKQICLLFWQVKEAEKNLTRLTMQLCCLDRLEGGQNGITDEMIMRARDYPISQIVEVNNRDFALCPFHEDVHPSLYCKNNFYYCFSCNARGDAIDLFMEVNAVGFADAVKELAR